MKEKLFILFILSLSLLIRIYGINWDQNQHLHPDERFLTMVGTDLKIPKNLLSYFNPQVSSLNPYNTQYKFFVYGTFPLTLNKIFVTLLNKDNYNDFAIYGRFLSALADVGIVIVIYLICLLWEKQGKINSKVKFLASFFYGIAVLPIQLSHFFAVDTFLSLFMLSSLYFSLRYFYNKKLVNVMGGGLFFGLALGCKISAVFILPLLLLFLVLPYLKKFQLVLMVRNIIIFVLLSYVFLRFADPKFFNDINFLNPRLNPQFLNNLKELNNLGSKDSWFPPAIQWMEKKPIIFALQNIIFYGLGFPYFLLTIFGGFIFLTKKRLEFFVLLIWVMGFFLYQSSRFAATMRYFIFLYPFFAIWAGMGFSKLFEIKKALLRNIIIIIFLISVLIWPISFLHIYSQKHSRVEASYWINKNIPENSFLAQEHWDDSLPVGLPDRPFKKYDVVQMPVFGPDNEEKWKQINETLEKADYYVITSNRAYGSIMTVPKMYPKMVVFYQKLFSGKTNFKLVKTISSYPTIDLGFFKWEFNDDYSEEAFTVYDHPKIIIFKKI